jgi:hypothetical protein
MILVIVTAVIAFALGWLAALIKTNSTVTHLVNSVEKSYWKGHKEGWLAALADASMVRSKYYEYFGPHSQKD